MCVESQGKRWVSIAKRFARYFLFFLNVMRAFFVFYSLPFSSS